MNWVDTPLLVYASVEDHPAEALVTLALRHGEWGSTALVLLEVYQVLTRDYEVASGDAVKALQRLAHSAIHWVGMDFSQVTAAAAERARRSLQSADALLLLLAREDRGTLVSVDHRLLRAAEAERLASWNPIPPAAAAEIARWESQHLPAKGPPRLLSVVEHWLRMRDQDLAAQFVEATGNLRALPL